MLPLIGGIEEPRVNAMVELVPPHAVTAAIDAIRSRRAA
jgi:hypothetical protein